MQVLLINMSNLDIQSCAWIEIIVITNNQFSQYSFLLKHKISIKKKKHKSFGMFDEK